MTPREVDSLLKSLTIKDLRVQLRARGQSPAGGQETLAQRLKELMISTGDYAIKAEDGSDLPTVVITAGLSSVDQAIGKQQNNYERTGGQNVGNFMTDRPSSRVLAAPGGASQIVFGDYTEKAAPASNNYSRPAGQNVGNMMTDRPSSRVLNAPGGKSQITFG